MFNYDWDSLLEMISLETIDEKKRLHDFHICCYMIGAGWWHVNWFELGGFPVYFSHLYVTF